MRLPASLVVAVFLDAQGNFQRYESRTPSMFSGRPQAKPGSDLRLQLWELVAAWKLEMGFSPSTVVSAGFCVPDLGLGIAELPRYLENFLENPFSEPDEVLRKGYFAEVEDWRRKGKFVLRWGTEYWMNQAGEVTDT